MRKWMMLIIIAGVITAGGVALASDGSGTPTSDSAESTEASANDMITLQEAKEIALQEADGLVKEVQLDTDDGMYYYEVEIHNGTYEYEIEVDALTGKIIDIEKDAAHKNIGKYGNILSMDEAIRIAQEEAPQAFFVEVELDEDDGRLMYDIDMRDDEFKYEFDIDATTGEIVDIEKEANKRSGKKGKKDGDDVEVLELSSEGADERIEAPKIEKSSILTMEEAVAIAREHGSGDITEVDRDDGVYEIEMEDGNTEYEIEIDVYSGEVVSFEKDID